MTATRRPRRHIPERGCSLGGPSAPSATSTMSCYALEKPLSAPLAHRSPRRGRTWPQARVPTPPPSPNVLIRPPDHQPSVPLKGTVPPLQPAAQPCVSLLAGVPGESGSGDACRASAILARAQRRDVRPNIWASRRSDSGLPACTLSRYAATAASLTALASSTSSSRCPPAGMGDARRPDPRAATPGLACRARSLRGGRRQRLRPGQDAPQHGRPHHRRGALPTARVLPARRCG